jgi:hypothetical protein
MLPEQRGAQPDDCASGGKPRLALSATPEAVKYDRQRDIRKEPTQPANDRFCHPARPLPYPTRHAALPQPGTPKQLSNISIIGSFFFIFLDLIQGSTINKPEPLRTPN